MRLVELFGRGCNWFASINVLFVGDLPPVNAPCVFEAVSKKSVITRFGCLTAINIWKEYDELTINERQKKDQQFSSMLDCVRRGFPTDETLSLLRERVIDVPAVDKYNESGVQCPPSLFTPAQRHVCMPLSTTPCMLHQLTSNIQEIACTDEVDETNSTCKWDKGIDKILQKLNTDCNNTAGLEAKLVLTVGAKIMLRCNIDTKAGLVNGALGTVQKIMPSYIRVLFDHNNTAKTDLLI